MDTLKARAPYFAGLVGSGSLIVGLYSFRSPLEASRVYGATIPTAPHERPADKSNDTLTRQWMKTLSYAHGIRNIGFGSAVIVLAMLYHYEASPVAAQAIRRCLGSMLLFGSVIPVGDTMITAQYMGAEGVPQADRDLAKKASFGHALRSLVWLGFGAVVFWT